MSDVGVAPAPSAAPAPAPAPAAEVPINPNPPSQPTPIGAQAPDKPAGDIKGSEHRPESRREAIQKAFAKAQEKAEPAKAKMGHNQPPVETKVERDKPKTPPGERIDLKKRPDDQPKAEPPQRGDHGHFAPREQQAKPAQPGAQQQQRPAVKQLPEGTPYRDPPQRMSERAKAEWHAAPESVRGEVHRMQHEFGKAYQAYKADHDAMNSIRPFHQMAQQHGTTLDRALSNYTAMEHKLREDVVGGLDLIVNNLNLTTPEGRKLNLQDVAWHIVNQTPEQHQLLQSKNRMMAQTHQLQAASQRIAALEQHAKKVEYAQHFHQTRAGVDHYAASHPRLDELAEIIENEIKLGFDLDSAYRRAELLRPTTQAAQTRTNGTAAQTRNPTAQTRNSDRSISGAPDGGPSDGQRRRPDKPVGRREAIANAMRRVNGAL